MVEITVQELEKAARNLERVAAFLGERRNWIVGEGGESDATNVRDAASTLFKLITNETTVGLNFKSKPKPPTKLEPSAKVSALRLSKFADFLNQLLAWFASQSGAEVSSEGKDLLRSILGSLALINDSAETMLGPKAPPPPAPPPTAEDLMGEIDRNPVAEVDPAARLVLEVTPTMPLLQTFKGVTELTVEARKALDDFLASQSVEIEKFERRRLQDKLLRWIEGIPEGQVLVVKLSGLTGKPQAYSSYKPKKSMTGADNSNPGGA
jgi:hypothetical protein